MLSMMLTVDKNFTTTNTIATVHRYDAGDSNDTLIAEDYFIRQTMSIMSTSIYLSRSRRMDILRSMHLAVLQGAILHLGELIKGGRQEKYEIKNSKRHL